MAISAALQSFSFAKKTENANTKINVLIPPKRNARTKVTKYRVKTSTTEHTLTFLRPLNTTTVKTAAAAGATSLTLTADPGKYSTNRTPVPRTADNLIAPNDLLVVELSDRTYVLLTVSAVGSPDSTGAVAVTVNALPTGGVAAGAKVWFLGVAADIDPATAAAHPVKTLYASGTNAEESNTSLVETINQYEPILAQIDNSTAASVLETLAGVYGP